VTSSDAVDEQYHLTSEMMLLVSDPDMLSLMQTHEARACGPFGQRSYVCYGEKTHVRYIPKACFWPMTYSEHCRRDTRGSTRSQRAILCQGGNVVGHWRLISIMVKRSWSSRSTHYHREGWRPGGTQMFQPTNHNKPKRWPAQRKYPQSETSKSTWQTC
jgi:hypothetical protein